MTDNYSLDLTNINNETLGKAIILLSKNTMFEANTVDEVLYKAQKVDTSEKSYEYYIKNHTYLITLLDAYVVLLSLKKSLK
jgi:hypothetical protein